MRFHRYPNLVIQVGILRHLEDAGEAKGGGRRVRAQLFNPSSERAEFDLRIPVLGVGWWAIAMEQAVGENTESDVVWIRGRLSVAGDGLVLVVEELNELLEEF